MFRVSHLYAGQSRRQETCRQIPYSNRRPSGTPALVRATAALACYSADVAKSFACLLISLWQLRHQAADGLPSASSLISEPMSAIASLLLFSFRYLTQGRSCPSPPASTCRNGNPVLCMKSVTPCVCRAVVFRQWSCAPNLSSEQLSYVATRACILENSDVECDKFDAGISFAFGQRFQRLRRGKTRDRSFP
jgi:hypothetical protein